MINALKRTKSTQLQALLSADARYDNIRFAFEVRIRGIDVRDKHLLLVDDLMTTGVTLQEAGRALLKLHPASITAVVACRVM